MLTVVCSPLWDKKYADIFLNDVGGGVSEWRKAGFCSIPFVPVNCFIWFLGNYSLVLDQDWHWSWVIRHCLYFNVSYAFITGIWWEFCLCILNEKVNSMSALCLFSFYRYWKIRDRKIASLKFFTMFFRTFYLILNFFVIQTPPIMNFNIFCCYFVLKEKSKTDTIKLTFYFTIAIV